MNILFITADQWRGECLSCLGHPIVKTPHLDSLAAESVSFTRHYAQATPCAPSRTSLHTGRYLFNHRCVANGTPVSSRFTNWAIEAGKAGYEPSLFGYTDTAIDPAGIDRDDPRLTHYSEPLPGIGHYTPMRNDVSLPWLEDLTAKGYQIPERWWDLYAETVPGTTWYAGGESVLPLRIPTEDHETHFMVDHCRDWIDAQTRPWITHLSLLRPHPPFVAPEPYNAMYEPDESFRPTRHDIRAREAEQHPWLNYLLNESAYACDDNLRLLQERRSQYFGLMSEVDDNLGRLFQFLKETDRWNDTLVIFTSDHGEQMGDHWLMSKLGFYESSYHVPLIVKPPEGFGGNVRGGSIGAFTEHVDVMPTMLEMLEIEVPRECDGRSLTPALVDGSLPDDWRRFAFWEYDFRDSLNQRPEQYLGIPSSLCSLSVLRDRRFKYVHFAGLPPLLYDLENDPGELHNLGSDPGYRDELGAMAALLLSHRMRYVDRGLTETIYTSEGPVYMSESRT